MNVSQVVTMRFIALMANLVLFISFLWKRDFVKWCLPLEHNDIGYTRKDTEMIIGFSISLILLFIEILGFATGVTLFFPLQQLFSLTAHAIGCISIIYLVTEVWSCTAFWWIFAFCNVLPAIAESALFFRTFILKVPL
ncbi:transmembrane protein-like protein [Dinothrombium tinctorium]|uniref:Transmembrane protein 107 n=1 Tax=Dinothrombium tinctorium TaxID=1965070 RepID=A0A3S3RX04_9ACAR|nr:transmembrane protein-like protein [Dinothrombium tinctorium]